MGVALLKILGTGNRLVKREGRFTGRAKKLSVRERSIFKITRRQLHPDYPSETFRVTTGKELIGVQCVSDVRNVAAGDKSKSGTRRGIRTLRVAQRDALIEKERSIIMGY